MKPSESTIIGPLAQIDIVRLENLARQCKALIHHLDGYAINSQNFDDEAFSDIMLAHAALADATPVIEHLESFRKGS